MNNVIITFKFVSPVNNKISALDESDILHHDMDIEKLKLYFSHGYNPYPPAGLSKSETAKSAGKMMTIETFYIRRWRINYKFCLCIFKIGKEVI